jgi:hypothetical protein
MQHLKQRPKRQHISGLTGPERYTRVPNCNACVIWMEERQRQQGRLAVGTE